jgi:hypothetical protein
MGSTASVYTRSTVDFFDEDLDDDDGAGLPVRVSWRVARFVFASVFTAGIAKHQAKGKYWKGYYELSGSPMKSGRSCGSGQVYGFSHEFPVTATFISSGLRHDTPRNVRLLYYYKVEHDI